MLSGFLLFLIVAVALGIIGWVVKGLFFLFIIGCVVLLLDLIFVGWRGGRARERKRVARPR